jgi:uncharacterized protein (TIGR03437 family)
MALFQRVLQVPSGVATDAARVNIGSSSGTHTASNVQVAAVAPSLFVLNGSGLAAAEMIRISAGVVSYQAVYRTTNGVSLAAKPISMGATGDLVYPVLFGIGRGLQATGTAGVAFPGTLASTRPASRGFTCVRCCSSSTRLLPHAPSRCRAVAFDPQLPPTGPVGDSHP